MFQSLIIKRQIYTGQGTFLVPPKEKQNWCPSGTASIPADLKVAHVTKGAWAMAVENKGGENPSDFQPRNSTY